MWDLRNRIRGFFLRGITGIFSIKPLRPLSARRSFDSWDGLLVLGIELRLGTSLKAGERSDIIYKEKDSNASLISHFVRAASLLWNSFQVWWN